MKRVFHHWDKWECYKNGFYDTPQQKSIIVDEVKLQYSSFLSNDNKFKKGIDRVFKEWPISCEQFLTNKSINRIAWLGQASACIELGIPSQFKGGFNLLSSDDKNRANNLAKEAIIDWESKRLYK